VSSGELIVGLGYTNDLRSLRQVAELLGSGDVTGTVFIGIVLPPAQAKNALKQIDDAAAEIASTVGFEGPGRSRARSRQR
jgi:hypothetical protein